MIRPRRVNAVASILAAAVMVAGCSSSTDTIDLTGATGSTADATGPTGDSAVTGSTGATGATGSTAVTGATAATGGIAPDACVLLTEADALAALGVPVERVADPIGEGVISGEPDSFESVCYYQPVSGEATSFASLVVIRPGTNTETEIQLEIDNTGVPLEGLGDEAFVVGEQAVTVRTGSILFAVFVIGVDGSPDTAAAETIARLAVERV